MCLLVTQPLVSCVCITYRVHPSFALEVGVVRRDRVGPVLMAVPEIVAPVPWIPLKALMPAVMTISKRSLVDLTVDLPPAA